MDPAKRVQMYADAEELFVKTDAVIAPIYWYTSVERDQAEHRADLLRPGRQASVQQVGHQVVRSIACSRGRHRPFPRDIQAPGALSFAGKDARGHTLASRCEADLPWLIIWDQDCLRWLNTSYAA